MEKKLSFLILFVVLALAGCGTSLGKAVGSGDRATVVSLLDKGADVNEVGRIVLHLFTGLPTTEKTI